MAPNDAGPLLRGWHFSCQVHRLTAANKASSNFGGECINDATVERTEPKTMPNRRTDAVPGQFGAEIASWHDVSWCEGQMLLLPSTR